MELPATSWQVKSKPTIEEYENQELTHIELTGDSPPWDPSDPDYARHEDNMTNLDGTVVLPESAARG